MLGRWLLALAFVIALVVAALDLSSGAKTRQSAPRTPALVETIGGRGEDPSLPQASETDDTAPGATPTISY